MKLKETQRDTMSACAALNTLVWILTQALLKGDLEQATQILLASVSTSAKWAIVFPTSGIL